ncbi:MAG: ygjT [Planctomycetaceae bacterium]|nr:ygjT [Planctomycetaceae bacterium]
MILSHEVIAWSAFAIFIIVMLLLDLGVLNRKEKDVTMKNALTWTAIWILSALAFAGAIYFQLIDAGGSLADIRHVQAVVKDGVHGAHPPAVAPEPAPDAPLPKLTPAEKTELAHENALLFVTGYLVEEMLSVDNLFVFVLIFQFFRVPTAYQRTVLYWGILGAILFRGIFIAAGLKLIEDFPILQYLFGGFLIYTGIKLFFKSEDDEIKPEKNIIFRLFHRCFRMSPEYHGKKFFTRIDGRLYATPLLLVVIIVETTDIVFAVDSIPAIFSVTRNPFIVYTSNVFAIMGLRSMYFALAGLMQQFHYLKYGLSIILTFVGAKMVLEHYNHAWKIPPLWSLLMIMGILGSCIAATWVFPPKVEHGADTTEPVA